MLVICKGPGSYVIDVEFSACCEHMQVEGEKDFLLGFPEQRFVIVMKRKLEWRKANGKPLAVIFRIDKYKGDFTMSPKKTCEVFIIKGLKEFPNIDHEVDTKLYSNPNQEARKLADQGYMQLRTTEKQTKQGRTKIVSKITSIKSKDCKKITKHFDNRNLNRSECSAPGGWRLFTVVGGEYYWLEIAYGSSLWSTQDEGENRFGNFQSIEFEQVEWRMTTTKPSALIFPVTAQDLDLTGQNLYTNFS